MLSLDTLKENLKNSGYPRTSQYIKGIVSYSRILARQVSRGYSIDHDLVFQVCLLQSTKIEANFDETRGATFFSYIKPFITSKVYSTLLPNAKVSKLLRKAKDFAEEYEFKHSYYPTISQISEHLGITNTKLLDAMATTPTVLQFDSADTSTLVYDPNDVELGSDIEEELLKLPEDSQTLLHIVFSESTTAKGLSKASAILGYDIKDEFNRLISLLKDSMGAE